MPDFEGEFGGSPGIVDEDEEEEEEEVGEDPKDAALLLGPGLINL